MRTSCPVVRPTAGLHANQTARHVDSTLQSLGPADGFPQHRLAGAIDTVQLKHLLCQINTECRNLVQGMSLLFNAFPIVASNRIGKQGTFIPLLSIIALLSPTMVC